MTSVFRHINSVDDDRDDEPGPAKLNYSNYSALSRIIPGYGFNPMEGRAWV